MGRCWGCCQENCGYQTNCSCSCHYKEEQERKAEEETVLENTVLVSHRSCLDGSACAVVFLVAGGKRENIYFTQPSHEDSDEVVDRCVENHTGPILVADVSISLSLAEKYDQRNTDIVVLDHHKTATPLNKFDWCEIEVENNRAGGMMLYDHLKTIIEQKNKHKAHTLRKFVEAVDDHDRWVHAQPCSKDLNTFHEIIEQEAFVDRFSKNTFVALSDKEKYVVETYKEKCKRYVERKKRDVVFFTRIVQGRFVKIGVVEAGDNQSILGNAICSDPELGCDIAILCNGQSVSLRSGVDCLVDLSVVAKLNGGGGHFHAGGTSLGKVLGENFAEHTYKKLKF